MSAKDGIDGYFVYFLFKPTIVINDIQMHRRNGIEMVGHIRTVGTGDYNHKERE